VQTEFVMAGIEPAAVYRAVEGLAGGEAMQLFETYLLVPEEDRLLIIDQHALHERMNYDALVDELRDSGYEAQQLIVPVVIDVAPAQSKLIESNFEVFSKLGIELEPFGGSSYQVTAICHLYEESSVPDMVYRVLDELQQGDLFDREDFMADLLRLATRACRASVKAGDRLGPEEKRELIDGFRRMRPPYTCPHGRPIITELTLTQMEKSFRRRQ
jgi:DNA mismatch repair protein MutL